MTGIRGAIFPAHQSFSFVPVTTACPLPQRASEPVALEPHERH